MTKLLLIVTFCVSFGTAFSQIHEGQLLMGGSSYFSSKKQTNGVHTSRQTDVVFAPNAGYFFMDQLAGGIRVNIGFSKLIYQLPEDGYYRVNAQALAPFLRYYLLSPKQKLNLFVDASYFYGRSQVKSYSGNPLDPAGSSKHTEKGYGLSAGPALFLTPGIALELMASYRHSKYKGFDDANTSWMTGLGFQIHLGDTKP
ncbi:MAG TPA: outer membrane beta-barrel protein [Chitinophagaceae bacterium]